MDKKYWEDYYKKDLAPKTPTNFAKYITENYLEAGKNLIELGCGNARDALYFVKHEINVLGVEQSEIIVNRLNDKFSNGALNFIADDFTNFKKIFEKKFDYIYSRFTLHAVTEAEEDKTINWVAGNLVDQGLFFLEVRSTKDLLFGKGELMVKNTYKYEGHNRRFVDFETIVSKIEKLGLKIVEKHCSSGFAIYGDRDPIIIRILAQKR